MKAIFKRQDLFLDRTYKDYTAENISLLDIFKPHFEWEKGGTLLTTTIPKLQTYG